MSTTTPPRKASPARTIFPTASRGAISTGRASAALSARSKSGSTTGRSCASARLGAGQNDQFQYSRRLISPSPPLGPWGDLPAPWSARADADGQWHPDGDLGRLGAIPASSPSAGQLK